MQGQQLEEQTAVVVPSVNCGRGQQGDPAVQAAELGCERDPRAATYNFLHLVAHIH